MYAFMSVMVVVVVVVRASFADDGSVHCSVIHRYYLECAAPFYCDESLNTSVAPGEAIKAPLVFKPVVCDGNCC